MMEIVTGVEPTDDFIDEFNARFGWIAGSHLDGKLIETVTAFIGDGRVVVRLKFAEDKPQTQTSKKVADLEVADLVKLIGDAVRKASSDYVKSFREAKTERLS